MQQNAQTRERSTLRGVTAGIVMAVIAVGALVACNSAHARRTHQASGPRTPLSASAPMSTAQAWQLHRLGAVRADTLFGDGSRLYTARSTGSQVVISRLDPRIGSSLATAVIPARSASLTPGQNRPVIAGGFVWAVSPPTADGQVTVHRLDPDTLRPRGTSSLDFAGVSVQTPTAALAATPNGHTVLIGAGTSVVTMPTGAARTRARLHVTTRGFVSGLAADAAGTGFFVTIGSATQQSAIQARDLRSGRLRRQAGGRVSVGHTGLPLGQIDSLTAVTGGVWVGSRYGGNGQSVLFLPTDFALAHVVTPGVGQGGGGVTAVATETGGTVWLGGGPQGLACLDPQTASTRESTVFSSGAFVSSVVATRSADFALDNSGSGAFVATFTPPKSCSP